MSPRGGSQSSRGTGMVSLVLVLLGLVSSASATRRYIVGGDSGWTQLAPSSISYDESFRGITLQVGDLLQFDFPSGNHALFRVPRTQVASCNSTDPSFGLSFNTTTATSRAIYLQVGYWGIISGNEQECRQGRMHFGVNVTASSPAPAPATDVVVDTTPVTALPLPPAPATAPVPAPAPALVPAPALAPALAPARDATNIPSPPGDGGSGANDLVSAKKAVVFASAVAYLAILLL